MNYATKKSLSYALASLLISFSATPAYSDVQALKIIGLTGDSRLVSFFSNNPGQTNEIGTIIDSSGKSPSLVGIDFRVQDGNLYGVSVDGQIYTIDTSNAAATPVSSLTVPLSGTSFGVDFNPAADRLRIISDTGQNLRHNVNSAGITIDDSQAGLTPLTYMAPPTAPVTALGITGAAYTNNDLNPATGTNLFDIDATLDQLVIQAPPNNGIVNFIGLLGADTSPTAVGFDIYSKMDSKGKSVSNQGFASLTVNNVTRLYRVGLLTGSVRAVGKFNQPIVDIAVELLQE